MKHNRFSKWIERLLVLLPLFYVAISSAYVIFNKNAKDSYSGVLDTDEDVITSVNEMRLNNNNFTYFRLQNNFVNSSTSFGVTIQCSDFVPLSYYQYSTDISRFIINVYTSNITIDLYDGANTYIAQYTSGSSTLNFKCVITGYNSLTNLENMIAVNRSFYVLGTADYSFVNNVMTYSMSEFNKLGFGKLDFTSWFTSIFMNGNTNNVYVQFVNSYLNYFLLVECVYFIPMIIYWFIHFGESVVERFIAKGDNW